MVGGRGRGKPSGKYDSALSAQGAGYGRGFGGWGFTWWYDSGGGWDDWSGGDSWNKGDIGVLSLRRTSRDSIVSVSK